MNKKANLVEDKALLDIKNLIEQNGFKGKIIQRNLDSREIIDEDVTKCLDIEIWKGYEKEGQYSTHYDLEVFYVGENKYQCQLLQDSCLDNMFVVTADKVISYINDKIKQLNELSNNNLTVKEGMRIELISMGKDNLYKNKGEQYENPNKVPPGTKGTVTHIDSIGTIHVEWENGSTLGLINGEDNFKVIPDNGLNRQLEEPEMEIN